jgi:transposase InsO family protein
LSANDPKRTFDLINSDGQTFQHRVRAMGIRDRTIPPGSPWQNGYAERLIGTLRRECLDPFGLIKGPVSQRKAMVNANLRMVVYLRIWRRRKFRRTDPMPKNPTNLKASI